jgi:hypothetical protein
LRSERDRWAGVAESSQRQLTYAAEKPKPSGWWPFGRSAPSAIPAKASQEAPRPLAPENSPHRDEVPSSVFPTAFLPKDAPLL